MYRNNNNNSNENNNEKKKNYDVMKQLLEEKGFLEIHIIVCHGH